MITEAHTQFEANTIETQLNALGYSGKFVVFMLIVIDRMHSEVEIWKMKMLFRATNNPRVWERAVQPNLADKKWKTHPEVFWFSYDKVVYKCHL